MLCFRSSNVRIQQFLQILVASCFLVVLLHYLIVITIMIIFIRKFCSHAVDFYPSGKFLKELFKLEKVFEPMD